MVVAAHVLSVEVSVRC